MRLSSLIQFLNFARVEGVKVREETKGDKTSVGLYSYGLADGIITGIDQVFAFLEGKPVGRAAVKLEE